MRVLNFRCIKVGIKKELVWIYSGIRFFGIRGYKFDSIGESQSLSADVIEELDKISMVSLKTIKIPDNIRIKLYNLSKQFIKKKDLEKLGRYISKKITSRNCVELPKILSSKLLCYNEEDRNKIEKMLDKKSYKFLKTFITEYKNKIKDIDQASISYSEDIRHKINISFFPEISIAYTLHTFNSKYSILYRIFNEIKLRIPNFLPTNILHYSQIPAVGIIAFNEIYNHKYEHILSIQPSEHLLAISKYLTDHIPNIQHQINLYEHTKKKNTTHIQHEQFTQSSYDLIILSHTLLSLYDHNSRNIFIKNLWNKLLKGGIIIIVENGTPTGFRMLHAIREMFICDLKYDKFHIVAPCSHESICPLALTGKDWCHFSQRVHRLSHHIYCKGSRAKNVEEEKYSYLVIKKEEGPRTKYSNEQQTSTLQEKSFFWPRVVMPTIKAGKHVLIDVCSYPHNFERLVVTKSSPLITNLKTKNGHILKGYGYKNARKLLWGDLWRFTKRVTRPDARLYTPEKTKQHLYRLYTKMKKKKNSPSLVDNKTKEYFDSRSIQYYGS
ncbi:mitochondrial ribosomal protein S22 precursor, putative [Plasmodium sp. DRC-Itaito]|nr:mitochondrial ribosomal protein S22 precursor, putative [Plasmodium sp. DRC-Itaito]